MQTIVLSLSEFEEMAPKVSEADFSKLQAKVDELASQRRAWVYRHPVATWGISLVLGTLALVVTIFGILMPHLENDAEIRIKNNVSDALKEPLKDMGTMKTDIAGIRATLDAWSPAITSLFFKKVASLPNNEFVDSLPQIRAAATTARQSGADIPVQDLVAVAKRAIQLSADNSQTAKTAWETATALMQYQSAVFSHKPPVNLASAQPFQMKTEYMWQSEAGLPQGMLSFFPQSVTSDGDKAAAMDFIGVNRNIGKPAPGLLHVSGGSMKLDGMHLKNIIITNVHVFYHGGAVQLENVYFLNCTFSITSIENGRQFATNILLNPSLTISLS